MKYALILLVACSAPSPAPGAAASPRSDTPWPQAAPPVHIVIPPRSKPEMCETRTTELEEARDALKAAVAEENARGQEHCKGLRYPELPICVGQYSLDHQKERGDVMRLSDWVGRCCKDHPGLGEIEEKCYGP